MLAVPSVGMNVQASETYVSVPLTNVNDDINPLEEIKEKEQPDTENKTKVKLTEKEKANNAADDFAIFLNKH